MKTSLLQNLGLSLALTSLGCSEAVSPAWIQENSCNMDAVNRRAPDYSIDSEGHAQRGATNETVSPSKLAAFQASQTSGYRFCVDPNSRLDSIIGGTTFRAYAIASSDAALYIGRHQQITSPTPGSCEDRINALEERLRQAEQKAELADERAEKALKQRDLVSVVFGVLSFLGLLVTIGQFRVSQNALQKTESRTLTDLEAMFKGFIRDGDTIDFDNPNMARNVQFLIDHGLKDLVDKAKAKCSAKKLR